MRRSAMHVVALLAAFFAAGVLRADVPHRAVTQADVTLVEYDVTLRDTVAVADAAATLKRIAANHRGMAVSIDEKTRHAVMVLPASRTGELMKDALVKSAAPAAAPATGKRIQPMKPVAMTATPWNMTYQYDSSGNILSVAGESYAYDAVNRLTSATLKGYTQSFSYDEFGNILTTSIPNATGQCTGAVDCVVTTTVDSSTNRLRQTTVHGQTQNVTYDTAGNITFFAGHNFTWDSLGMMTSRDDSGGRQFVYDENDERIGSFYYENWTFTPRDVGGRVLREYSTGTNAYGNPIWTTTAWHWHNDQIYRGDQVLASIGNQTPFSVATPVTQHFHLDHLGSTRLVTVDGHEVSFHNYFPFGTELATAPVEDPAEMTHKFAGHETEDDGNGTFYTYNMHARSYNASAGRFLSVDPNGGDPHRPQSWNRYAYVENNPVGHTDPTGQCTDSIVCLNYGHVEDAITVSTPAPQQEGTWAAVVEDMAIGTAHFNAQAAAEWGKYQSGAYDAIAPDNNEMLVAWPAAGAMMPGAAAANAVTSTGSVFWSGSEAASEAAASFARASGGTTLEMTPTGQALTQATATTGWGATQGAWAAASRSFAEGAAGDVTVFQAASVRVGSMWATEEFPALVANPAVTGIRYMVVYPNGAVIPVP